VRDVGGGCEATGRCSAGAVAGVVGRVGVAAFWGEKRPSFPEGQA
jgi:hypothetical protein